MYQLHSSVQLAISTQLSSFCAAKPSIKQALLLLEDLVSATVNERPRSKTLLYKSISPCVEVAISLFPVFLSQADILDLLMGFFLTLFSSLKAQVCMQ